MNISKFLIMRNGKFMRGLNQWARALVPVSENRQPPSGSPGNALPCNRRDGIQIKREDRALCISPHSLFDVVRLSPEYESGKTASGNVARGGCCAEQK
ncbi:hypothetical protein [Rhizobium laguerreae]|uniref:hypothetical protein n=1 Tax=Rhizobium laguerreae TaxID=1076926 RepID=UPI001C90D27E|nr:hypothetical protein [Rhizobium laguerreae]MBY3152573.1 hypothetical protein [Rhizobium laguerreae]MBY3170810.1 hypothetical protein [Rhizobium laguerreae]